MEPAGRLYVVGTPIGNLDDVSPRLIETLRGVDLCYAEDTRRTGRLLERIDVATRLRSLHQHNEASRTDEVLRVLGEGRAVALVTDAGTPGVSDPGSDCVRAALAAGHEVVPIPGPSAVTAALSASGFEGGSYLFLGFPPRRGRDRTAWLAEAVGSARTVVVFEAPHRLHRLLSDLAAAAGGHREAAVCRELTKLHEEVVRGSLDELTAHFEDAVRGEVTVVLEGAPVAHEPDVDAAQRAAARLDADGVSTRSIARQLEQEYGLTRNEAYRIALDGGTDAKGGSPDDA